MIFWVSVIVIAIISFLLALRSMFGEKEQAKHLKTIKKHLSKEKILFKKE